VPFRDGGKKVSKGLLRRGGMTTESGSLNAGAKEMYQVYKLIRCLYIESIITLLNLNTFPPFWNSKCQP
jgi:hypothetical protein